MPRHYRWLIGRLAVEWPDGLFWAIARRQAEESCGVSGVQAAAGLRWLAENGVIERAGGRVFLVGAVRNALEVLDLAPDAVMVGAARR